MKHLIEFCNSNRSTGGEAVIHHFEAFPEQYDVIEYGCLGNCGECCTFPYALVDGTIVAADTAEQLIANIDRKIKETEAMLDLLEGDV